MSQYLDLLKRLLPHGCYTLADDSNHIKLLRVDANAFENHHINVTALLLEMFPDTIEALISKWEETYGIITDETKPLYLRVQLLLAKINTEPGISVPHMQSAIYPFLGYNAAIEEYHVARCDDPRTLTDDDYLAFEIEYLWLFVVYIDNALVQTDGYSKADIRSILDEKKPAHTDYLLDIGPGFFTDDLDSLTDFTFLAI